MVPPDASCWASVSLIFVTPPPSISSRREAPPGRSFRPFAMSAPCARPGCSARSRRGSFRPTTRKRWLRAPFRLQPGCGRPLSRSPTQRRPTSMDEVARLPAGSDRAALFGNRRRPRCRRHDHRERLLGFAGHSDDVFDLPKGATATLVFKGGTSLSKAFGAIRRFSEDIDLSFDRAELGYTGDRDPEKEDQQEARRPG